MSLHRFFIADPLPASLAEEPVLLPLSDQDLHHAASVLRLHAGERIVVVGPDRVATVVELTTVAPDAIEAVAIEVLPARIEPRVTLIQGLAKGDKLDLVVEKVTEIGVEQIVPVAFARTVVRLDSERGAKRGERLRRVAAAAAKQSQRSYVPAVLDPIPVTALLPLLERYDIVLVAWEDDRDAPGIGQALRTARAVPDDGPDAAHAAPDAAAESHIAVIVGPEGGLTAEEVAALERHGAIRVSLGATVLRTETAGILAVALCIYESGGLGGRVW